jgi:uncharacterized damage-inducible protein DinB
MRLVDPILAEFDQEAPITRRVLEAVPGDKLTWKPHPKSMSLGRLAQHVAEIQGRLAEATVPDSFDVATGSRPEPTTHAEIMETFEKGLAQAKEIIGRTSDDRATAGWTLLMQGNPLMTVPRIGVYRSFLMNHLYHHRGQLSVYLRLLDVPVPHIYGPSADDNPFVKQAA